MTLRAWVAAAVPAALIALGCGHENAGIIPPPPSSAVGALEVLITAVGTTPDPDGFVAVVSVERRGDIVTRTIGSTGGKAEFAELPPARYSVRLESLADNCTVWGDDPASAEVQAGATAGTWFVVDCPRPGPRAVFERVGTITGGGSDRYILEQDSTFRYQSKNTWGGFWEEVGRYSAMDSKLTFDFCWKCPADNPDQYQAFGKLGADTLTVHYNGAMALDAYEDGVFIRSSKAPAASWLSPVPMP